MRVANPSQYKAPLNAIDQPRQYALLVMDLWSKHEQSPMQFQLYQGLEREKISHRVEEMTRAEQLEVALLLKKIIDKIERNTFYEKK